MAEAIQREEYKRANSRTGANSDEDEKEEHLAAPILAAAAEDGVRAADNQATEQLIPDIDEVEQERYRQFVIKQQRELAEIRKERERREREDRYDAVQGWAPAIGKI